MILHRHTGGLENTGFDFNAIVNLHRHTGGLEIDHVIAGDVHVLHRHTGGLEKPRSFAMLCSLFGYLVSIAKSAR